MNDDKSFSDKTIYSKIVFFSCKGTALRSMKQLLRPDPPLTRASGGSGHARTRMRAPRPVGMLFDLLPAEQSLGIVWGRPIRIPFVHVQYAGVGDHAQGCC